MKKVTDSGCNKCNSCSNCLKAVKAWDIYKKQRNLTNKITKSNKRQNLLADLKAKSSKNDLRGIWRTIKLAANLPTKNTFENNIDDEMFNAENLNKHFCDIGPRLKSKIPIYDNISFTDFLTGTHESSWTEFSNVPSDVIEDYIKSLSSNKAITDLLPLKIIKIVLPILIPIITHIVNLSLSTGKMPKLGKYADITPIFKGGDPVDLKEFDNYRPISILPILSKCIEHCVSL